MRSFLWVSFCLLFSGFACKEAMSGKNCLAPSGRFINTTVLDQCPGSMPADIPHFCFELYFRGSDSVWIDNGFEKYSLPYHTPEKGCRFKVAGASLFGDMFFVMESDSILHLMDTAWTREKTFSIFKITNEAEKSNWRFEHFLNDCLLTGQYDLYKDGKQMSGKVDILSNGQLNGLKPYLGYSICYAGDCLEETDPPARTIDLFNDSGGMDTYVWMMRNGKKSIEFYTIGEPIPDEKGGRAIGPLAFEIRN